MYKYMVQSSLLSPGKKWPDWHLFHRGGGGIGAGCQGLTTWFLHANTNTDKYVGDLIGDISIINTESWTISDERHKARSSVVNDVLSSNIYIKNMERRFIKQTLSWP